MTTESAPPAASATRPRTQHRRRLRPGDLVRGVVLYPVFVVVAVVILFPVVWMVYSSFKSNAAIFDDVFALPTSLNLDNYVRVVSSAGLGRWFGNSVLVTVVSVAGLLVLSTMGAYAFAMLRFRGKTVLFLFFLVGLMVPPQALIISGYGWMSVLGLVDSRWALVLTYFGWTSFGVLVLRNFFESVPREIVESARIDGAGHVRVFTDILLPLARPSVSTVAIFLFMWTWNDFLYPLVYLQSQEKYTLPLGVMQLNGQYQPEWGLQMAGLTVATVIPLVVYYFLQKQFVRGILVGAVKG